MSSSNTDNQILQGYEIGGMTPAEIAHDLQLDEGAVKAKLMILSRTYRKECGMEPEDSNQLNFTEEQLERVNEVIFQCATEAELPDQTPDYKTRLKAAIYVRDDKKGRHDIVKNIQGQTFNILNFNQMIQQARNGAEGLRKRLNSQQPIDC